MSHLSPSHDRRHLPEEQEHQQREQEVESFHAQNPNPNIKSSELPRNRPALLSQTGNPTYVETHVPELRLSRDPPLRNEALLAEDQEAEDLESEGMPLSPTTQISCTDRRRGAKRRKGLLKGRQRQMAIEKKLQMLNKNLNPIPFVPNKILDFSKHEELLKLLGLWEFAHIEFDKNLRADLIALLIAGYSSKDRCSFVYDGKIPVNRADLGRALNLPVKKSSDCGVEAWPEDFVSFVDEFVSTWMLLHDDTWMMPEEVLAWTKSIKVGQLEKVDWPGLIWFMVEKELTQGSKLGDCYYASHLQHLIKVNREDLLRGNAKENVAADIIQVDEEADGKMVEGEDLLRGKAKENVEADILQMDEEANGKMIEGEDLLRGKAKENVEADIVQVDEEADGMMVESQVFDGGAKVVDRKITVKEGTKVEQNTSLFLGQNALDETAGADAVSDMDIVHSAANAQHVDISDDLKKEDHSINLQNICDVDENHIDNADNVENADNACKVDSVENYDEADEFENADGNSNTVTASFNAFADDIKNVDTNDDVQPEVRDEMSFESSPREEPGQWLFGGKRCIGEPFLRSCSMAEEMVGDKPLTKDHEGGEQVEGFNDMRSCNALEGMTPRSLMQAIEAEQMPYSSSNFCDQSSLELLSTRHETNVMMVSPTIFGNAPKRDAAHAPDISHRDLGDNHKRMRVEAPWDSKPVDFELCLDKLQQWAGKAKIASRERDRQHANMQQFFVNELENKERIIQQLQTGFEELQRRRQAELNRLEKELYVMSGLLDGYRRAIKDTQGAFAEYRKRCPQVDKPIYQDAGCGGVVKSVRELEEERQRREEEEERKLRIMVEEFVKHADKKWNSDMERYHALLQLQHDALTNLEEEAVHLRRFLARH